MPKFTADLTNNFQGGIQVLLKRYRLLSRTCLVIHSGDLKESIMEKLIPTRIGKHRQGTQEEADKQGYRFFMHSESKRPKKGSPENTNSETPTTNRK